jgi:hypothetical protein
MSDERYRLDAAIAVRKLVLQLGRESRVLGLANTFARSLGVIRQDLITRPNAVGVPWFDQGQEPSPSGLHHRSYYLPPVQVRYVVHEASRMVWLMDVRLLPALN